MLSINSMSLPESGASELPQRLLVCPESSRFEGSDGRVFLNADPQAIVRFFLDGGKDLPIDIEHSTQLQGRKGLPAPAVGWVTALELEGNVLYAVVNWTEKGAELIRSRAYRYYSPAYFCIKEGSASRITGLASIGLTNIPNLPVPALNHEEGMEGVEMDKIVVCNALGIDVQTADEQVVEQINTMRTQRQEALNRAEAAERKLTETEAEVSGVPSCRPRSTAPWTKRSPKAGSCRIRKTTLRRASRHVKISTASTRWSPRLPCSFPEDPRSLEIRLLSSMTLRS